MTAAVGLAVLAGCNDDTVAAWHEHHDRHGDTNTITTMQPQPTADIGEGDVPDQGDDGTSSTVSGAVPGQDGDELDPPDDGAGGPAPGG